MRYAFLIALREYAENVKTKGFWVGILLFPVILMAMLYVPRFLEEHATPTRYFVLVDQSGEAEAVIDEAIERSYQRRVYDACLVYLEKNRSSEIEQMAGMGVSGYQINYAHSDQGGHSYGLTYPSEPQLFSDDWWKLTGWFMREAKKQGAGVSLSDYTLGFGQGWFVDELLRKHPEVMGQQLRLDQDSKVTAETVPWSLNPMHPKSGHWYCEEFFGQFEQRFPSVKRVAVFGRAGRALQRARDQGLKGRRVEWHGAVEAARAGAQVVAHNGDAQFVGQARDRQVVQKGPGDDDLDEQRASRALCQRRHQGLQQGGQVFPGHDLRRQYSGVEVLGAQAVAQAVQL